MAGLPVRPDGTLYSGRPRHVMVASAVESHVQGTLTALAIDEAMVVNELETLAKQRDAAFSFGRTAFEVMNRVVELLELLPSMVEDKPETDVLEQVAFVTKHIRDAGICDPKILDILKAYTPPEEQKERVKAFPKGRELTKLGVIRAEALLEANPDPADKETP